MAFNSNGEVSYLVLDSLSHGSKYGLEIIEYISQKTGGNYIMKKPTLYSCLTRMEKKGYLSSSFWSESEMGGKRHYYTITNAGKAALEELEAEFANASFDSLAEDDEPEQKAEVKEEDKTIVLQQDNMFNLTAKQPVEEKPTPQEPQNGVLDNQIDIFSLQTEQEPENKDKKEYYQSILEQEPVRDDAVLLNENEHLTTAQEEQNKKLFDTSSELKKYRKKKSFSENQIEMAVVYEKEEDQEIQRQRIEQLKASMLSARQNRVQEPETPSQSQPSNFTFKEEKLEETAPAPVHDDAIFITSRYTDDEIPVQKKIAPTNIEIDVTDSNLPAPKRDTNLEPTYRDMMSKLFERKKEKEQTVKVAQTPKKAEKAETPVYNAGTIDSFVDYNSLKKYYAGHGIEFKEYTKTSVERVHNTNLLLLISSAILLLLSGIGSIVIFGILAGAKVLNASTNFLFYTVPLLFLVYTCFCLIKWKLYPSRKAGLTYTALQNWAIFALTTAIILVVNIICGMQAEAMANYLTSLFLPILGMFLAFPCNFHLKRFLFKRYAK